MLKALANTPNGKLVVIGLSDKNVANMKGDNPVLFNMADLGLKNQWVSVSYKHPNGNAAFPENFVGIGIALSDKALESMITTPNELNGPDMSFLIFRAADEPAMEALCKRYIGTNTLVRREGFAPSDIPDSRN